MAEQHPSTIDAQFWAKVRRLDSGCWEWTGSRLPTGYGMFGNRRYYETARAHRIAYILKRGEIPSGTEIDHLCRNRCCVNPDHLEAVTHSVNQRRAVPFRSNLRTDKCKYGHSMSDAYVRANGQRMCRSCSISGMLKWQDEHKEYLNAKWRAKRRGIRVPTLAEYRNGEIDAHTYARDCDSR